MDEIKAPKRDAFTKQHVDGVAAILRDYPGARTEGFPSAVRDLRDRVGCRGEEPAINFVPDAFRLNEETCEIELFEVEVTHPVPTAKLADLGWYWSQWDAEDGHEWLPVLIQIDRFGTAHRRDLSIAYFELSLA